MLEPISHGNQIIRKKDYLRFSKFKIGNWKRGWSRVTFLNTETLANQFLGKGGIAHVIQHFTILPRLTLAKFIANIFHSIAEASSIIFYYVGKFVSLSFDFLPMQKFLNYES